MILLAAGVGAVPGAFFWGWMADKIGRRKAFIGTADSGPGLDLPYVSLWALAFPASSRSTRPWCRNTCRRRNWWTGDVLSAAWPDLGRVVGAFLDTVYRLARPLRRRPAAGGIDPLLIRAWVPEPPRWLVRMGRFEAMRRSLAWTLQGCRVGEDQLARGVQPSTQPAAFRPTAWEMGRRAISLVAVLIWERAGSRTPPDRSSVQLQPSLPGVRSTIAFAWRAPCQTGRQEIKRRAASAPSSISEPHWFRVAAPAGPRLRAAHSQVLRSADRYGTASE